MYESYSIFFSLFWFVCWIATVAIGAKKGEGCISVITGFLLGPIGLIIALVSKGNRVQCPYCKEYIDKKAVVCPYCRKEQTI